MTDVEDSIYPWDMTHDHSTACTARIGVREFHLYAGELPDLDEEAAWFVRLSGRVIAAGIADNLGAAQANAEQAAENWADRDLRVFKGT